MQAVIFDMDGLLVDSMLYWIEADHDFLGKYGIELTDEMIKFFSGRGERENMNWIKEQFGLEKEVDALLKERAVSTDQIYSEKTNLMPGVAALLSRIKRAGLKTAIATGAPARQLKLVVERFKWQNHFETFVSVDDVSDKGKPEPAVYLGTAARLGVKPERCVVLEDAENGVVAAKRAGMACVAVPDPRWSPGDFSKADLIVESLEDEKIFTYLNL